MWINEIHAKKTILIIRVRVRRKIVKELKKGYLSISPFSMIVVVSHPNNRNNISCNNGDYSRVVLSAPYFTNGTMVCRVVVIMVCVECW